MTMTRNIKMLKSCITGLIGATTLIATIASCSLSDLVGEPADADIELGSPDAAKSLQGSQSFYRGVIALQSSAVGEYAYTSALLTDELTSFGAREIRSPLDDRNIPTNISVRNPFSQLQLVRAHARQGRGLLIEFAKALPPALIGHLFIIEAMADIYLADIFCSGIPLSTVDYGEHFTPKAGSSTADVYRTAIALLDSAIVLTIDSTRLLHFAHIAKARALLSLGHYSEAGSAVAEIPTNYTYQTTYAINLYQNGFRYGEAGYSGSIVVSDNEGMNGLPFISSQDPRTLIDSAPHPHSTWAMRYTARKYPSANGYDPVTIASGIEARLIEAEVLLRNRVGTAWLDTLNALRTACLDNEACPSPAPSGSGNVAGLPRLADPGLSQLPTGKTALQVRLDLILKERGYWLFLTGIRQSDLRRFVRNDGRPQESIYPTGFYSAQVPIYGSDTNLPVPEAEIQQNPKYHGCINRDA